MKNLRILMTVVVLVGLAIPTFVLANKVVDNSGKTTFYGVFIGQGADDFQNVKKVSDDLQKWPGWAGNVTNLEGGTPQKNTTKAKIKAAIDAYKAKAKPGDEFIFWYLGHGSAGAITAGPDGKIDTPQSPDDLTKTDPITGDKHLSPGNDGVFESGPPQNDDEDAGRVDGQQDQGEENQADPDDEPKKGDKIQIGTDEKGKPIFRQLQTDDRYDDVIVVDEGSSNVITDDELRDMLSGFPYCVTMVIVLDSCFGSSFIDGSHDLQTITQKKTDGGVVRDVQACSIAFEGAAGFCNAMSEMTAHVNALEGLKNDGGTTKADKDGNNDGITTLKELHNFFQTGTYYLWTSYDKDGDGQKNEDGDEHFDKKEGGHYCPYHDNYDDDEDGYINEDPKPVNYIFKFWSSMNPANGQEDVPVDVILTWKVSDYAEKYDIYLGINFDDVNNATRTVHPGVLASINQDANAYDPYGAAGFLKLDQTYYWRVDEVNTTPGPTTFWTGEVWDFITLPYTVMDNFNGYASTAALRNVWSDYPTNPSAATVSLETVITQDGNSMKYLYENFYDPYYAESDATMTNLVMDPNWYAMGAKSISIWFRGTAGNDANELMSMKLTDSDTPVHTATVLYDGSPSDVRDANNWHEWVIDLAQFTTVNMRKVAKIAIRFGDGVAPVGSGIGTVYFDNLRLYATRCVLAKRAGDLAKADYAPPGNPAGDCVVDYQELQIMANTWLTGDKLLPTANPGIDNLVAYWPMNEGDGNSIFTDPCDPCYHGTFSDSGVSWLTPGVMGTHAIHFDGGDGTRVSCGKMNPAATNGELTVAIWVKWAGPHSHSQGLISKRRTWSSSGLQFIFECDTGGNGSFALRQNGLAQTDVYSPVNILDGYIGKWVHLAATFDGNTATLYFNGADVNSGPFSFGGGDPNTIGLTIGNTTDDVGDHNCPESFNGDLDEAHIYNRALDANEVSYLADTTPEDGYVYVPVPSAAEVFTAEPEGNRVVNFRDFAILADSWLEDEFWP